MHAYACVLFFVEILLQLKAENIFDYYTKNQVNSNRFVGNIEIKDNENGYYSTANVKNLASKYSEEIEYIDLENYSYYDEVSLNINKNQDFSNRKIYVLTNDNTANEAIKLAQILKENGAYIVKNTFDTAITSKDVIYNFRSDLYVMEHSGLVLSLNSAYSKDDESLYLNYDERINSKDPISTVWDIIN